MGSLSPLQSSWSADDMPVSCWLFIRKLISYWIGVSKYTTFHCLINFQIIIFLFKTLSFRTNFKESWRVLTITRNDQSRRLRFCTSDLVYQNINSSEVGSVVLRIWQGCMSIYKHQTVRGGLTLFSCVCLNASQIFTLMEPFVVVIVGRFTKSIRLLRSSLKNLL